jgi:hypothetical protein
MAPTALLPLGPVAPISASNPGSAAQAVLDKCHVGDMIPLTQVSAMGQISSAKDLVHYVPLTGREPQLKENGPAWVIQIHGDVQELGSEIWTNPTCVVTAQDAGYYATGPVRNTVTGKVVLPEPPANPPDLSLPALAP